MLPRDAGLLGSYRGPVAHGHPDSVHCRSRRSIASEISQNPLHLPLSCLQKPLWAYWRRLSVRLRGLHALPSANRKLVSLRSLEARLLRAALDDGFGVCPALSKANARYGQGTHLRRRFCPRLLASRPEITARIRIAQPADAAEPHHYCGVGVGFAEFRVSLFSFLTSRIPLLLPRIPVRVIPIPLPESQPVVVQQHKS